MQSKKIFSSIIFVLLSVSSLCEKTGIKASISPAVVKDVTKKLMPILLNELKDIVVPDQNINVDAGIATLHIYLRNIHFGITSFPAENLNVAVTVPKNVDVTATQIKGSGRFDTTIKLGFLSSSYHINVDLKWLNVHANVELGSQKSTQDPTKLIPSAKIVAIDLDLDFDFDISSSILGTLVGLFKSAVKDYIRGKLVSEIRNQLLNNSKTLIDGLLNKIPLEPQIYHEIAVDDELLADPLVREGRLIVDILGKVLNTKIPESSNPPFPVSEGIPDLGKSGKLVEALVSPYVVKSAIYTLILSKVLDFTLHSTDIPSESPIKLDTSSLDIMFKGLKEKYGEKRPCDLNCELILPTPEVNLTEGIIHTDANIMCQVIVNLDESRESFVKFKSLVHSDAKVSIQEEGKIVSRIESLKVKDTELVETTLEDVDLQSMQYFFNTVIAFAIPVINQGVLSDLKIQIPEIEGIKFTDSELSVRDGYIELGVTPEVESIGNLVGIDTIRTIINDNIQRRESILQYNRDFSAAHDKLKFLE